jgi:hypothetical protein
MQDGCRACGETFDEIGVAKVAAREALRTTRATQSFVRSEQKLLWSVHEQLEQ